MTRLLSTKVVVRAFLVVALVVGSGCRDASSPGRKATPDQLFGTGMHLVRKGCYEEAIEAFRGGRAGAPTNHAALGLAGQVLTDAGQFDAAVDLLTYALEVNPYSAQYRIDRARALRSKGGFTRALNDVDNAIARTSNSGRTAPIEYRVHRAQLLEDLGRHSEALVEASGVLQLDPHNINALLVRAQALGYLKDFETAIKAYDRLIAAAPHSAQGYEERAKLLAVVGRTEDAARDRAAEKSRRQSVGTKPAAKCKSGS